MKQVFSLLLILSLSSLFSGCRHPEVMGIDIVKGYSKSKGDQYFRKGAEAFNSRDYPKAYNAFVVAAQYDEKNADSFAMAGYCQSILKNYGAAYEYALRAVSIDEDNPDANYLVFSSLYMQDKWEEALVALNKLEKIAPSASNRVYKSRAYVYLFAGVCCMQLKNFVQAKQYFENGLELKDYKSAPRDIISKIESQLKIVNNVLKTK